MRQSGASGHAAGQVSSELTIASLVRNRCTPPRRRHDSPSRSVAATVAQTPAAPAPGAAPWMPATWPARVHGRAGTERRAPGVLHVRHSQLTFEHDQYMIGITLAQVINHMLHSAERKSDLPNGGERQSDAGERAAAAGITSGGVGRRADRSMRVPASPQGLTRRAVEAWRRQDAGRGARATSRPLHTLNRP